MNEIYPRSVHPCQWRQFDQVQERLPTLSEFLSRWDLSREQLAHVCHVSQETVKDWFRSGDRHREPTKQHRLWMAIADRIWRK